MSYTGKVISGDCHLDIPWLPEDLFTSRAPAHLKHKMPRVEETDQGLKWFSEDRVLGWVGGAGIGVRPGGWDPYVSGMSKRLDRMEELKFFSDANNRVLRPGTPDLRIKDQDSDGVSGEVIYGVLGLAGFAGQNESESAPVMGDEPSGPGYGIQDPEVITAVYDAYSEWMSGFCKSNPDRLVGLTCLSPNDPNIAAAQLRRAADLGLRGAEMNVASATDPLYHKNWDALWESADETGLPISFHTVGIAPRAPKPEEVEDYHWVLNGLVITMFQLAGAEYLASIIYGGALDRYLNFKFILGECGIAWIPYVLFRMDDEYERQLFHLGLSMKPSEYWARQGYSTFQIEHLTNEMIDAVGEDNIMWGSDYPHPDCVWPDSRTVINDHLGHLDESKIRKLVCDNTAKLYGFPN